MTGDSRLRIGFLGAGLIASYHSKSLRRSGAESECGVVRAGVYDPDDERAQAFAAASGHHVCASEDEVLDTCDAVYICTWTSEHPRLVETALRRNLAVFCEKPLAVDLAAAARVTELVRSAGVTNQVGLVLRHSPAYLWARHLVNDPHVGRVMTVVFRDDQFIPTQGHYASDWRADQIRAGAGTMLEHSIHDVDMLRFVVGDVTRVSATTANFHGYEGIEDVASALILFRSGATGTLTSVWHDNLARPSLRRVEVFCERRHVVIEGNDWFGPVRWTDSDGTEGALEGDDLVAATEAMVGGSHNPDGAFVRAVVAHEAASPDMTVALAAHRVVDAIYRSAATGGSAVDVEHDDA